LLTGSSWVYEYGWPVEARSGSTEMNCPLAGS
jgi:hypothetical protein